MRGWVVLLAVVVLVAVDAWRASRPLVGAAGGEEAAVQAQGEAAPHYPGFAEGLPARDPFRYAEPRVEPPAVAPPSAGLAEPVTVATPTPRPSVHLVGLVRQEGRLLAALSVFGRVVVVSAGDEVDGVAVLDVDEERGVRIRDPEGRERQLARR